MRQSAVGSDVRVFSDVRVHAKRRLVMSRCGCRCSDVGVGGAGRSIEREREETKTASAIAVRALTASDVKVHD